MSVLRYTVCLVLFATVMFGLGRWSVAPEVRTQVVTVVKLVPQAATPVPSSTNIGSQRGTGGTACTGSEADKASQA